MELSLESLGGLHSVAHAQAGELLSPGHARSAAAQHRGLVAPGPGLVPAWRACDGGAARRGCRGAARGQRAAARLPRGNWRPLHRQWAWPARSGPGRHLTHPRPAARCRRSPPYATQSTRHAGAAVARGHGRHPTAPAAASPPPSWRDERAASPSVGHPSTEPYARSCTMGPPLSRSQPHCPARATGPAAPRRSRSCRWPHTARRTNAVPPPPSRPHVRAAGTRRGRSWRPRAAGDGPCVHRQAAGAASGAPRWLRPLGGLAAPGHGRTGGARPGGGGGGPSAGAAAEEINTKEVAQRITAELKRYSIPQAIFAQRILCRSQGTLSDLLRNPKPWSKLKSGRETFRRMWKWLQEPEFQRMSALRLAACKRKEQEQQKERALQPKKQRLVFTDLQRRTLIAIFKENKRPSKEMQVTISQQLGLELNTVSNFFMNARRRCMNRWAEEPSTAPGGPAGATATFSKA
uniref:One cut domain family member n=1 Tax=Macaca nemestrina TaxID=9545 RepID=A0A2K6C0H2_MACNE